MTDYDSQQPPQGGYGGPPPTQPYAGQPQAPAYGQYPGYPPAYGYPPNPYVTPYGPPPQTGPKRPGLVIAGSVLAYVNAGMIILAGALLLFGAAIVNDFEDAFDSNTNYGVEFAIDGVVNLIMGGLLIAGAVGFTSGKPIGRTLLTVGNGLVIAASVYWLLRFSGDRYNAGDGYIVWSVIFAILAILSLAFSFTGAVNRWLAEVRQR